MEKKKGRKKVKNFFVDSWKLLESLFKRKDHHSSEVSLLLETWIMSNPTALSEGFLALEIDGRRGRLIFSLTDLEVGRKYISEKGTKLIRTNTEEVLLGEGIKIPIANKYTDLLDCKDEPTLLAMFQFKMAESAIEFFSRKRIDSGIPLLDVSSQARKVISNVQDLEANKLYKCSASDGIVRLMRLGERDILFAFYQAVELAKLTSDLVTPFKVQRALNNEANKENAPVTPLNGRNSSSRRNSLKRKAEDEASDEGNKEISSKTVSASHVVSHGPPAPPPPLPPPPPPGIMQKKPTNPRKKLRPLQWTPLPDHKIKSTVWSQRSVSGDVEHVIASHNKELEELFALSPTEHRPITRSRVYSTPVRPTAIHLLEIPRANNIAIVLSHLKHSFQTIKEALLTFDENILTIETLTSLKSLKPTAEEKKLLLPYKDNSSILGGPEKFLITMLQVPRLEARIELFAFKLQMPARLKEIQEDIAVVTAACEEVRKNDKFTKVLQLILALGSVLNQGTYLNSNGFKLDSLLKLTDTKTKNQSNFLHYLTSLIRNKMPEILDFAQQMPHTSAAAKVALEIIVSDMNNINATMKKLANEVKNKKDIKENDQFLEVLNPLYKQYKGEVATVTKQLEQAQSSFCSLASYFGEENPTPADSSNFFSILNNFSDSFKKAADEDAHKISARPF